MTKRILMMITILLLLCGLTAGAEGTEDVHNALSGAVEDLLYRIVLRTETGDKTMGSGVLFMDKNVLLTAAGCCRDGELYAVGKDGEQRITACDILSDSGAALLEMAAPAAAEPLTLAGYSSAGVTYIFGVDASGKQKIVPLERIGRGMYHEQETLQLSGEEGLLPGAVVLDAQGQLLCMVIAQQAEGRGMYTALAADVLYSALTGEKDADAFLPAEAKWAAGKLSVSWKDEERTEGVYLVTISGGENNYYTSNEVKADQRSIELPVPPGHTYFVQVQWVEDASQAIKPVWSAMTAIEVSAEPFTRYTYTQECHLASAPAGQNVTSALPPMEDITVAALGDKQRDIYLQVRNAYDVSEKERLLMTVELIAADG